MTVASVERAFRLLRAIDKTDATLTGLARKTGLPVGTVARLMTTMEQIGAVTRDGKAYRPGPVLGQLTGGRPVAFDLASVARAHVQALATATDETAGVAEFVDGRMLLLAQVSSGHDVDVKDWTGATFPLHSCGVGFVMLAHRPADEVDSYLEGDLESFTENTVTEPEAIRRRLAEIHDVGWLCTVDEYTRGVTTIAAPVLDADGWAVGAIDAHGPSFRFPLDGNRGRIGELVRTRAAAVSEALGWRGDR